jgi:hypothetical protein
MAIVRIDGPSSTPTAVSDYEAQNDLLAAGFKVDDAVQWSGTNMTDGVIFRVGGTLYRVDGATAITGTTSPYVKITPAGATASASFVANLTGVSWNSIEGGYYDGSGNRYLFDESLALTAGAISSSRHIASISASVLAYLRDATNINAGTLDSDRIGQEIGANTDINGASISLGTARVVNLAYGGGTTVQRDSIVTQVIGGLLYIRFLKTCRQDHLYQYLAKYLDSGLVISTTQYVPIIGSGDSIHLRYYGVQYSASNTIKVLAINNAGADASFTVSSSSTANPSINGNIGFILGVHVS